MNNNKVKFSIKKKIFLFILLPISLFIGLFAIFTSLQIKREVVDTYEVNYSEKVDLYVKLTERILKNGVNLVENSTALFLSDASLFDENKIKTFLNNLVLKEDLFFGATIGFAKNAYPTKKLFAPYVYRDADSLAYMDIAEKIDYTTKEHSWFYVPSQTLKPFWTEPYTAFVLDDKKLITYTAPFFHKGEFIGVLEIDFDIEYLDDYLKKTMKSSKGNFIVLSTDGTYISHPDDKRIVLSNFKSDTLSILNPSEREFLWKEINKNEKGFANLISQKNNEKVIVFYSHIGISNWVVGVYESEETVLSNINSIFNKTYYLLGLLFVIISIFLVIIVNKLLLPVTKIKNFASIVAEGKLDEQVNVTTKDEFGSLANDLNIMSKTLQTREKELRDINAELEQRVIQRTEELNTALGVAKKLSVAVEQSPVLITITDINGNIEYINPEYKRVTGFDENDVIGKKHTLIRTNVITEELYQRYQKIIKSGRTVRAEFESVKKDGSKFWMKITGTGIKKENNDFQNVVFIEDDITFQKEFEIKLKKINDEISTRNKYITDSIEYAKRIQKSILPDSELVNKLFPDNFIIYYPKDIVSGDFYWITQINNLKIVAVIDCTGHGVPGALMSMIGNTLLNEIVVLNQILTPAEILNKLNDRVIEELNKEQNEDTIDGMDIALCIIDEHNRTINFAGAYRPLIYLQENEIFEIKGTRKSIGDRKRSGVLFESKKISITENTTIYLFSDGIIDQNNSEMKKFGTPRFKNLLLEASNLSLKKQSEIIINEFNEFKGSEIQRDDVTVMAIKPIPSQSINSKFDYYGEFSHKNIIELGEIFKTTFEEQLTPQKLKSAYFVVMELMQNIGLYSEETETIEGKKVGIGAVNVKISDEYLIIKALNKISESNANLLIQSIENFNSLSKVTLKELSKTIRKNADANISSGHIGLIEISKRIDGQIKFQYSKELQLIDLETKIHIGEN